MGLRNPSRETKLSGANADKEIFPVQLTTCRIAICVTIHTFLYLCMHQCLYVCVSVCTYGHHLYQSLYQPDMVDNPAHGQLNRENVFFPVPVRA